MQEDLQDEEYIPPYLEIHRSCMHEVISVEEQF